MLHVTNGSVALSRLHALGLPGECVPWDDVLHEGPVPAGLSEPDLRRVRAEFLGITWDDVVSVQRSLEARDQRLDAAARTSGEIVLWFEHDLYDQLHVLQVLSQMASLGAARLARVSAVLADDYLAAQPDVRLREWYGRRTGLTDAQWQAAGQAWAAFRASDPAGLMGFDHEGAWPALLTALRRHLQQFPSIETGLSRTETQTLQGLIAGPQSLRAAFRASNEPEAAIFMGDLGWWYHIRSLITGPQPLLAVLGEHPADFNDPEWWRDDETSPQLALTDAGRAVLAGNADRVALNGIDRWLGGVHLTSSPGERSPLWRWSEAEGRIV